MHQDKYLYCCFFVTQEILEVLKESRFDSNNTMLQARLEVVFYRKWQKTIDDISFTNF